MPDEDDFSDDSSVIKIHYAEAEHCNSNTIVTSQKDRSMIANETQTNIL